MHIPSVLEAERLLAQAELMNPGPWVAHSRYVALGARLIAEKHPRLDPEAAYILGLLHDIGRRAGRTHIRHLIDGYQYLMGLGYADAARISLTHSFPIADLRAYFGERDCSAEDLIFLEEYITRTELSEYDRLIQLCDTISMPEGFCLMEKRLVDVALRYGVSEMTVKGWEARFAIKADFEVAIGCSIYTILPGVLAGTFGESLASLER